jgi:hypothetical protein
MTATSNPLILAVFSPPDSYESVIARRPHPPCESAAGRRRSDLANAGQVNRRAPDVFAFLTFFV